VRTAATYALGSSRTYYFELINEQAAPGAYESLRIIQVAHRAGFRWRSLDSEAAFSSACRQMKILVQGSAKAQLSSYICGIGN
jgi:hypothetical protein